MIKYRIEWHHPQAKEKYRTTEQEFADERHFDNYYALMAKNHSYRKIIGYERVYEERKEFSANDLKAAFNCGKDGKLKFEDFVAQHFRRVLT